ncbi:helix-turn-helix domain-containing protein [Thalassospira profundimaris]|uniref:helix-turn-helix domain-containing protein n=1 Tax=Thalassospira profundimaris TaxID=502049 RepID=UPI0015F0E8FF|nr:helix-turn-helix domain-containing protein [Thalassospira profundimaris]
MNRFAWLQHRIFQAENLSSTARLVACALVSFVNDQTLGCFPKLATLAKSTGLGERTVRNALNELAEHKLVVKHRRAAGWFNTRNTYQLIGISIETKAPQTRTKRKNVPAPAAASAPAPDSASNRNTDLRKSDRRAAKVRAAKREDQKQSLPALPSDQNQLIEVVVRRWQQLSVTPWTLQNAREHVGLAIERVGIDLVTDRLNALIKRRGLKHTDLLDHLQGLSIEQEIEPAETQDWLGNVPEDWAAIARDFADNPHHNCPRPFMWLKRLTPSFDGDCLTLKADTPCVRDQIRNQFFDILSAIVSKRGYQLSLA